MIKSFPLKIKKILQLENNEIFGIDPRSLRFQVTCLESEKYISVADSSDVKKKKKNTKIYFFNHSKKIIFYCKKSIKILYK